MRPAPVAVGAESHPITRTVGGRALRHHVLHAQPNVASDCATDIESRFVSDIHVAKLSVHVALVGLWRTYAAPVRGPHTVLFDCGW